jgi:hypothetical protein
VSDAVWTTCLLDEPIAGSGGTGAEGFDAPKSGGSSAFAVIFNGVVEDECSVRAALRAYIL